MKRILMDTSALYALAFTEDGQYPVAARFFQDATKGGARWLLTDWVFSETLTLVKARRGSRVAISIGRQLRDPRLYVWTPVTQEDEFQTWAIFQRYADKEWSYVDCALFALSRRLQAPVFTFDHHFEQMAGIEKVP